MPYVLLIAGPTASGKSAAALALAEQLNGEIVNADAIQVYRELQILSARPPPADEARIPHHLYGFVPAAQSFSAGAWLARAAPVIEDILARGKCAIAAGGTGLYFRCLTQGLAALPPAAPEIRKTLMRELQEQGAEALHRRLARCDPEWAARVPATDPQRILRGLEVFAATGVPLSRWQKKPASPPLAGKTVVKAVLTPPRECLQARCNARVGRMIEEGALDEARELAAQNLPPHLPAMKALGLAPLLDHLAGNITLAQAADRTRKATRALARRQLTWARTQMPSFHPVTAAEPGQVLAQIHDLLSNSGLTIP